MARDHHNTQANKLTPAFSSDGVTYFKSSKSGMDGCVAVGWDSQGNTYVADTKNPECTAHTFTPHEWEVFVAAVKDGAFDDPQM